jgi:hypothetical protein
MFYVLICWVTICYLFLNCVKWATNCLFMDKGVKVFRREDSSIVFMGRLKNKLYLVDLNKGKANLKTCLVAKSSLD